MEKHHNDKGVQMMKFEMLKSLKTRYAAVEENEYLAIATALDPRFKDKFSVVLVKELLLGYCWRNGWNWGKFCSKGTIPKTTLHWPVAKFYRNSWRSRYRPYRFCLRLKLINIFLSHFYSSTKGNCYTWLAENKDQFPALAKTAQHYLSAPPTSVPSEQLFSGAGDVYYDKRNRLAPERAETLLFIKNNFKYMH